LSSEKKQLVNPYGIEPVLRLLNDIVEQWGTKLEDKHSACWYDVEYTFLSREIVGVVQQNFIIVTYTSAEELVIMA